MAKSVTVHHPPANPPKKLKRHFAAFGYSSGMIEVFGQLRHKTTNKTYAGATIRTPKGKNGFWIIHFVRDDFPVGDTDKYTLEVYDADALTDKPIQTADGLSFALKYDDIVVTSPQANAQVCTEFAAYGTAPGSTDVSGTISGTCSGQCTEGAPGPDWVLYCLLTSGSPGDTGTLTVTQGAVSGSVNFTRGPC